MPSSTSKFLIAPDLEWVPIPEIPQDQILALQEKFKLRHWIAKILLARGLSSKTELDRYFQPQFKDSHDPLLLLNMDKALPLLQDAISKKKKVMVYGDYDVDGTTAVSMMADFLWQHEALFTTYIPDRYEEGYGLSAKGVETAIASGVELLITLDCGIRAVENITLAREAGIEVILCDHHEPGETLPPASAILNPKQAQCNYPFDGLSGAGVGFKLIQAYAEASNYTEDYMLRFTDLLAVSIAADIVPVIDENRIFLTLGLQRLNSNQLRPGLKALLEAAQFSKEKLNLGDLLFVIAPRINAAGRLKSGMLAVEVLRDRGEDAEELRKMAQDLEKTNQKRRSLDEGITAEALKQCQTKHFFDCSHCNVVAGEGWHKGVVGIVASRLIENHYRPTVVLAEHDGVLSGSIRSIRGVDVHAALNECAHLLDRYGGHAMAAGLSFPQENLGEFRKCFNQAVEKQAPILGQPTLMVSSEIDASEIDKKSFLILEKMEPFGPKNNRPLFQSKMVLLAEPYYMGKDKNHVKFKLAADHKGTMHFEGVHFNGSAKAKELHQGSEIELVYSIERNDFRGQSTVQLRIRDWRS